jgi:aryl-alcohol dehydrogenase-like predicted oxidoreductase
MHYRKFGNTELMVSEVGFGAWSIGGNAKVGDTPIGWGIADDQISRQAVHTALDAGINFFDTADFYGLGHSEYLLGEILQNNTEVIIATKVGHRNIDEKIVLDYSKNYIIQACEQSLTRLKRNVIDYYQLHSARMQHLQQGECIEAMQLLKEQGKIRYWGLSLNTFYPNAEADYLMERNLGDGFQLVFNLINQRAARVMKKASENGYGIIARMPLQFGLLTGKFSSSTKFAEDDHRSFRLTQEIMQQTIKILEQKVWPICDEEKMSKTALALGFILGFKEISTAICGIRTPDHVVQNTRDIRHLSEKQMQWLQSLAKSDWLSIMDLMERQG